MPHFRMDATVCLACRRVNIATTSLTGSTISPTTAGVGVSPSSAMAIQVIAICGEVNDFANGQVSSQFFVLAIDIG